MNKKERKRKKETVRSNVFDTVTDFVLQTQ